MLNQTTTTKNRRYRKFLVNRRKQKVQTFKKSYPKTPFLFAKEQGGSLFAQRIETGAYLIKFSSKRTGRSAFAYGGTFEQAYYNMIRMFNLKYGV